jgi:hypothetical protein
MSDASKEMVKQLELYADTNTAFATAQLLGFIYLMDTVAALPRTS